MTYREALAYVDGLAPRGWRLGLDRMREFAHRVGLEDALGVTSGASLPPAPRIFDQSDNPANQQSSPRFIHVGGTNGKGSTTAYLQSILHESGYRTGAFFSPYVYDPRERIQLGRELIPEGIFAGLTAMLQPIAEEFTESDFGGISEFEFKTAMAFLFYKRMQCEWVALEVGLGGRLDATNIVMPDCSVIVSVGLDHTNILGNTVEEIAHEKAGIVKSGVPVVIGQMPDAARKVVEEEAARKGSQVWLFGRDILVEEDSADRSLAVETPRGRHAGLRLGIRGAMQSHDMALAVAACDAAGATRTLGGLQRGTANSSIPGRFEFRRYRGREIILDGAHNSDAAEVLVESLQAHLRLGPGGKLILVTGMVAGHDPAAFYRPFEGLAAIGFAVPIDFHRALRPEDVGEAMKTHIPEIHVCATVQEGLGRAIDSAAETDTVLVTGSFYLVGEVGRSFLSTGESS